MELSSETLKTHSLISASTDLDLTIGNRSLENHIHVGGPLENRGLQTKQTNLVSPMGAPFLICS